MKAAILVATATLVLLAACTEPPAPPAPPPNGAWTLEVCGGISWAGCGTARWILYPDKATCYEALAAMHAGDQPIAESGLKRNTIALCRPAAAGDGA